MCIQEPYTLKSKLINIPSTAPIVVKGPNPKAAILNLNLENELIEISQFTDEHTACAELLTPNKKYIIVSMYCQFRFEIDEFVEKLENIINTYRNRNIIITMDANAKSPLWYSNIVNDRDQRRGESMEDLIQANNLIICNI